MATPSQSTAKSSKNSQEKKQQKKGAKSRKQVEGGPATALIASVESEGDEVVAAISKAVDEAVKRGVRKAEKFLRKAERRVCELAAGLESVDPG